MQNKQVEGCNSEEEEEGETLMCCPLMWHPPDWATPAPARSWQPARRSPPIRELTP